MPFVPNKFFGPKNTNHLFLVILYQALAAYPEDVILLQRLT